MKKYKNMCIVCVLTWFLLGVKKKKAWATPRSVSFRSLIQNFRRASHPFHMRSPPPGSISPSFLNRVAILMHFALKRVRIEGFQQHSLNQTSFKSSPPEKFLPLYITITWQTRLCQFFSELKTVTRTTHCKYGKPLQ